VALLPSFRVLLVFVCGVVLPRELRVLRAVAPNGEIDFGVRG